MEGPFAEASGWKRTRMTPLVAFRLRLETDFGIVRETRNGLPLLRSTSSSFQGNHVKAASRPTWQAAPFVNDMEECFIPRRRQKAFGTGESASGLPAPAGI